jgi:hypothetical protein
MPLNCWCPEHGTVSTYSRNQYYVGLTTRPPFAAVLLRRHFTGVLVVGGAWQNERSVQPVLIELKARLKNEFGENWQSAAITALIEDSEGSRGLAELAEKAIPLRWTYLFYPIDVMRQSLESVLPIEGPVNAKLQIDENEPGAYELAQALHNKVEGGYYDALALCVYQAKEDEALKGHKEPEVDSGFNPLD